MAGNRLDRYYHFTPAPLPDLKLRQTNMRARDLELANAIGLRDGLNVADVLTVAVRLLAVLPDWDRKALYGCWSFPKRYKWDRDRERERVDLRALLYGLRKGAVEFDSREDVDGAGGLRLGDGDA